MNVRETEALTKALEHQTFKCNRNTRGLLIGTVSFSAKSVLVMYDIHINVYFLRKYSSVYPTYITSFQLNSIIDYLLEYGKPIDFSCCLHPLIDNMGFKGELFNQHITNEVIYHWGKYIIGQATKFCGKHCSTVRELKRKFKHLNICFDDDKTKIKLSSIIIDVVKLKSKYHQIDIHF